MGKTCGRGMKGSKARKSGGMRPGFEGGQISLARRQPKRVFSNYPFKKHYEVVNIGRLAERFAAGETVDPATLIEKGLLGRSRDRVKILATGDISHALNVKAHRVSASARQKIEAAGGTVEELEPPKAPRGKYLKKSARTEG